MPIYVLNTGYLFGREPASVESYGVYSAETDGFASGDDIRRYILIHFRSALEHHIRADMRELVHECSSADDGAVINDHFAGDLGSVGHDDVIM